MSLPRSVSLAVLVLIATAWATLMIEFGLWLAVQGPQVLAVPRIVRLPAGIAAISGGLVVFMIMVADRVFPIVGRRFSMWWVEMTTFLVFVFSAAVSGLVVFSGGA